MTAAAARALNRRLVWAGWLLLFVGLSFVLVTSSQFWTAQFNDSDDYMRMARVRDLLNGQGWYDLRQPRLSPGDHFVMPWSRFVDIPLAAVTLLFSPLVGQMAASGVAAFLVPLLWLLAFALVLPIAGRGLLPTRQGWCLLIALLCSFALLRELRPMRVDHHGPQIFFALAALVTLRLCQLRPTPRWRVLTGIFCGCGLAIGAESFLSLALCSGWIVLGAAWGGGKQRHDALGFATGLLGTLLLALPLLRPPADWLAHDLALPALPHLLVAFLLGAILLLLQRLPALVRWHGLALAAGGGLAASAVLWLALPELHAGLYGANMSTANQNLILGTVLEAKPYLQRYAGFDGTWLGVRRYWPLTAHNLLLPVLAVLITLLQLVRTNPWQYPHRRRCWQLWLLQAWFLLPVTALGLFWQSRVGVYMALVALVPLGWLVVRLWQAWARVPYGLFRLPLQLATLALLFGPTVWSAAWLQGAKPVQAALFPSWYVRNPCNFKAIADALNDTKEFGDKPLNIIATMTGGAELLYRTDHRVFAAPYDVSGNALAQQFFAMRDMGGAYQLARMHNINIVLMCDAYANYYLPDEAARRAAGAAAHYILRSEPIPPDIAADRVLVDYLIQGDGPDWLQPIPLPFADLHLYRVNLPPAP